MQVDLLRVIQDRRFYRVGSVEPLKADFRLISATHQDLHKKIGEGSFRQDFFYRINVISLRVPPLRERKEDIPVLAKHFIKRFAMETNSNVDSIDEPAMKILQEYPWPGNVRELENVVERAVVTSRKRIVTAEAFAYLAPGIPCVPVTSISRSLQDAEASHISTVLEESGWNISRAAKVLEVDRTTLHKKIRKYGLQQANSKNSDVIGPPK